MSAIIRSASVRRRWILVMLLAAAALTALGTSSASADPWRFQTPQPTGAWLTGIDFVDASHGWAVGEGGTIMVTVDGGETWASQSSGTTETLRAVSFVDTETGWAVGDEGTVLRTTDAGALWAPQAPPVANAATNFFGVAAVNASRASIVGADGVALYWDGYGLWNASPGGGIHDLHSVAYAGTTHAYAVSSRGEVLESVTGGANWVRSTPATNTPLSAVDFVDDQHGWIVGGMNAPPYQSTIFRTTNGGSTWTTQTPTDNALNAVSFADTQHGWIAGQTGIWSTTDGGATWNPVVSGLTAAVWGLSAGDAQHAVTVGPSGQIARTSNGTDWGVVTQGPPSAYQGACFYDINHAWAVGSNGAIAGTGDGGAHWTPQTSGVAAALQSVAFASTTHGWSVGASGTILTTTNGGMTWTAQSSGIPTTTLYGVDFPDATHGYAVGATGTILATNNSGATWTQQSSNTTMTLYAVKFEDAAHGWAVGATGTIVVTANGGANWAPQLSPTTSTLRSITLGDSSHVWAAGDKGAIISSTNGGLDWATQTTPRTVNLYGISFADDEDGWAVGAAGSRYYTFDGGATWHDYSRYSDLASRAVRAFDVRHAWLVGFGGVAMSFADTTPPTTQAHTPFDPDADGWFNRPVSVGLAADDGIYGIGVASTVYSLDGSPVGAYTSTLTVSTEGVHSLKFASTDMVGNIESTGTESVKIDLTRPTVTDDHVSSYYGTAVIHLTPSDALSGVRQVMWSLHDSQVLVQPLNTVTCSDVGTHTLYYAVVDRADNWSQIEEATFTVLPNYQTNFNVSASPSAKLKKSYKVGGTISPNTAPGAVTITVMRQVSKRWKAVSIARIALVGGRFAYTLTPKYTGNWQLGVVYPGATTPSARYLASSATKYFKVK